VPRRGGGGGEGGGSSLVLGCSCGPSPARIEWKDCIAAAVKFLCICPACPPTPQGPEAREPTAGQQCVVEPHVEHAWHMPLVKIVIINSPHPTPPPPTPKTPPPPHPPTHPPTQNHMCFLLPTPPPPGPEAREPAAGQQCVVESHVARAWRMLFVE
jgi:hypothetical protein